MTILRALRKRAWIVILLFLLHASQDAFGNRVSKTVTNTGGTTTTQYLVEDDVNPTGYSQVLDELTGPIGSAAVQRTYTYGLQRITQDQYISGWALSYYQYDGGGSVRQLTNSVGQVTDSYEYDAFGNSFTKTGTTPNNYLYRGEQFDSDLASTTSAPDTTIPPQVGSCPAIRKTGMPRTQPRCTNTCMPMAIL